VEIGREERKVSDEEFPKVLEEARHEKQEHTNAVKSTYEVVAEALQPNWEQLNALNPSDDED
jgi:hypothetical protein